MESTMTRPIVDRIGMEEPLMLLPRVTSPYMEDKGMVEVVSPMVDRVKTNVPRVTGPYMESTMTKICSRVALVMVTSVKTKEEGQVMLLTRETSPYMEVCYLGMVKVVSPLVDRVKTKGEEQVRPHIAPRASHQSSPAGEGRRLFHPHQIHLQTPRQKKKNLHSQSPLLT